LEVFCKFVMSKFIAAVAAWSLAATTLAVSEPAIIPLPQKMERQEGVSELSQDTRIYTDPTSADSGDFLAGRLGQATGYSLGISRKTTQALEGKIEGGILLSTSGTDAALGAEGYDMAFARLSALSEVAWSTKEARNFDDFKRRLKSHEQRLDRLGVNYRRSALDDGTSATKVGE